jgi:hypothetical protein
MPAASATPDWEILLAPFQSLLSPTGFRYFRAFVLTFAHLDGRLWVTQVCLTHWLGRHFTNVYRFLESPAWTTEALARQVVQVCLPVCLQAGGRVWVALDETVVAKRGPAFEGVGIHHDPMNRQHPRRLSRGHSWVCLAVLGAQGVGHWVALFVACALYVPRSACQTGEAFATKLALAVELLGVLPRSALTQVVAVADGAYARRSFVAAVVAGGRHVLSRLRADTVFYDLPPARRKAKDGRYAPGRPRRYGAKHQARTWAQTLGPWRRVSVCVYGRRETLRLKSRVVLQRTLGVKIRLVAVAWGQRPVVFLFCTDTTMTPEAIVEAYAARFAIETGFRDAKQSFGLTTYQVRRPERLRRLLHLCLWSQTLLRLACWHLTPEPIYGAWRKPLAYLTLAQQQRRSRTASQVLQGSKERGGTVRNDPTTSSETLEDAVGSFPLR